MSTASLEIPIPKPVIRKVTRLRWLVRLYVALEGIAAILVALGSAYWIGLVIDWFFEPTPPLRVVLWLLVAILTTYVAVRFFFSRILRKLPNSSLALLLERNYPKLRESLVTIVDAADRNRTVPVGNAAMLRHTGQAASDTLSKAKLSRSFHFRPLLWKVLAASFLILSIFAFSFLQPDAFAFWTARMQLDEAPWPRRVQLAVLGFDELAGIRAANVARDDDFVLRVEASLQDGHIAPEQIEIRYRLNDGRRGRDIMTKVGEALPGRDQFQQYEYTFKNVVRNLSFDVIGGDDRVRGLELHVVQRPQIIRTVFDCEFPRYIQRPPRTIPVSGRIDLPEGARASCRVTSNKALQEVRIHDPELQEDLSNSITPEDPYAVSFDLVLGSVDRTLLITLHDIDGVENREPYRIHVSVIVDQPPDVSVQLRGIGAAVTPQASIPFEGRVIDEYGISKAWIEYQVNKQSPGQRDLAEQPRGRRELTKLGRFDLAATNSATNGPSIELQPGQQLSLSVKAQDAYDLSSEPHIGSSQRFLLDVVTTSELRALLEKRELSLRQRFEAIYEKMELTRDLLANIEINAGAPLDDEELKRRQQRDQSRLSGALQSVIQLSYETIGVAEGFDSIVTELVNNRIDTEELKQRLQQGIADPLKEIANNLLPELEEHLQQLEANFTEKANIANTLQAVNVQAEIIVEAMKHILDRMLELESYNELVEMLRGIVGQQEELKEKTKQHRREKLRNLLGEE